EEAARATSTAPGRGDRWIAMLYRLPSRMLGDPLAVMVEKELRTLLRAPRFRLLFIMGFSFGLMVWLPMAVRRDAPTRVNENFLTFVCVYAVTLLGEVTIWNSFGFDRAATALYFVAPAPLRDVLVAKNTAAVLFVICEVAIIQSICALLRLPASAGKA